MLLLTLAQGKRPRRPTEALVAAHVGAHASEVGPRSGADLTEPVDDDEPAGPGDAAFVVTMVAHVAANLNAGFLLQHHHRRGSLAIVTVTVLLGVHLALVEREHLQHHAELYTRWGRPALAAALVGGAVAGALWQPGGAVLAMLRSALAGLLVLNVLQHHIKEQDVGRAPSFIAGGVLYGLALSLM